MLGQYYCMKQKQKGNDRALGVQALQSVVTKFFSAAEVSKSCRCNICLEKYEHREKGVSFLRETSSMFKIDVDRMKKFYHLLSAVDHKVFFKLQMPQLVFFEGGEGKVLFKTKGQAFISVHISPEMRKQIPNIFIDNKKYGGGPAVNADNEVHIKYFDTVVPSFKHGLSNDNLENKPQHYTFHSDERQGEQNILYKAHHNPDHEVAIVKFREKSLELLSQKQLRQLLKSPHRTGSIELIQAYVKPHDRESEFIFSQYLDYLKPLNALMFSRSLTQMKTEIGLISKYSKDYIPMELLEEYEQMLKEMPQQYCLYQTYKMVHYIEINRDLKVKRLSTVWFKDQHKELNFFGVMQFFFEQNEKVAADLDNITQLKDILQNEPTDLEKELLKAWEDMKTRKMQDYKQKLAHEPPPKLDEGLTKIKQEFESKKRERQIKKERSYRQVLK